MSEQVERAKYEEGFEAGARAFDPATVRKGHGYEGEDRSEISSFACGYADGWNRAYGEWAKTVIAEDARRRAGEVAR